jgi:hypothetical protein
MLIIQFRVWVAIPLPGSEFTPRKMYLLSYSAVTETSTCFGLGEGSSFGQTGWSSANTLVEQASHAVTTMKRVVQIRGRTFQMKLDLDIG